jgi:hypothetical protein
MQDSSPSCASLGMTDSLSMIFFFGACHAEERGISEIYENNVVTNRKPALNRISAVQECDARMMKREQMPGTKKYLLNNSGLVIDNCRALIHDSPLTIHRFSISFLKIFLSALL